MAWRNSDRWYGWPTRLLHWVVALLVFALFGLGYWMRTLGYYDPWYQRAPALHVSLGIVFICLVGARLLWRLFSKAPAPVTARTWEPRAAAAVHLLLYALLITMAVTGYLYATAGGKPADVFGVVKIAPLVTSKPLADAMGDIHEWAAYLIIAIAALHAAAALKHHFIDRDTTLQRIVMPEPRNPRHPEPPTHREDQS